MFLKPLIPVVCAFLLFIWLSPGNSQIIQYQLIVPSALDVFSIRLCFVEPKAIQLTSLTTDAERYVIANPHININRQGIKILFFDPSGCAQYQVDIKKFLERHPSTTSRWTPQRINPDSLITVPSGLWLWRPDGLINSEIHLSVKLPNGYSTALPWRTKSTNTYLIDDRAFRSVATTFGVFEQRQIKIQQATVRIAFLSALKQDEIEKLTRWITVAADALGSLNGGFPANSLQVIVIDVNRSTAEPVPFGMVNRGDGTLIQFFVNAKASEKHLIDDWTAYHEFAHLLLPFIERDDAWVSEGMASYYQYLLMGHAGTLNPEDTFDRLFQGFIRGQANFATSETMNLAQVSRRMRKTRSFRRVYWSGAIFWMEADLKLRHQNTSLLETLSRFRQGPFINQKIWQGHELFDALDNQLSRPFFTRLMNHYVKEKQFPNYWPLFKQLGIYKNNHDLLFCRSPIRDQLLSPLVTPPTRL